MALKRKRTDLTLAKQYEIIELLEQKYTTRKVAQRFDVSQAAVARISQRRNSIRTLFESNSNPDRKRQRTGHAVDVENALYEWYEYSRSKDVTINGPIVREKAQALGVELGLTDFKPSDGWLSRWKKRNNVDYKRPHVTVPDVKPTLGSSDPDDKLTHISSYPNEASKHDSDPDVKPTLGSSDSDDKSTDTSDPYDKLTHSSSGACEASKHDSDQDDKSTHSSSDPDEASTHNSDPDEKSKQDSDPDDKLTHSSSDPDEAPTHDSDPDDKLTQDSDPDNRSTHDNENLTHVAVQRYLLQILTYLDNNGETNFDHFYNLQHQCANIAVKRATNQDSNTHL